MGRGRLIWPVLAEIGRLDTLATSQDPDGPAPDTFTSGYDDIFMEPVIVPPSSTAAGAPRGEVARKEKAPIKVKAQVESRNMDLLQPMQSGNSPGENITLCFHFKDLEEAGLVDPNNKDTTIHINDRLIALYHYRTKALMEEFPMKPGMFAVEVLPVSYGLNSLKRNLLLVRFEDRELSVR
jgi:hypothetical protein